MIKNKRIVISGATGGIGREVFKLLYKDNHILAIASNEGRLKELVSGTSSDYLVMDFNDPGSVDVITDKFNGIDILINIAGINDFVPYVDDVRIQDKMNVNLISPMILTQSVLRGMLLQQSGIVVNIGSVFDSVGFPYYVSYSASKFGLKGFSESLRREFEGSGVDVFHYSPRAVKTSMNCPKAEEHARVTDMVEDCPQEVANEIIKLISNEATVKVFGFNETILTFLNKLSHKIADKILGSSTDKARDIHGR